MIETNSTYKGYQFLRLTEEQWENLYSTGNEESISGFNYYENEYLIGLNEENEVVDKFVYRKGKFSRVPFLTMDNTYLGTIKPRNLEQQLAIEALLSPCSTVKLIKGIYGSGKDFLMLSAALQLLEQNKFERIVFLRPNVGVRGLPDIGIVPGDYQAKLAWTLAPLYDKVGGEEGVQYMMDQGLLESVPLPLIRGRSFNNSIIYMTEGQNMTSEIAKLVISRVGDNSQLWINGDCHQSDKKMFDEDNGIEKMVSRLKGHDLFSYVFLSKTERSRTAELASLLDD